MYNILMSIFSLLFLHTLLLVIALYELDRYLVYMVRRVQQALYLDLLRFMVKIQCWECLESESVGYE